MGHAEHFLRRLDRLSDPHVELALRLYNDPDLLGATLSRAKVPESAERLAIALDDPREGPFLVVTRTGRFVTCLGRGMHTHGTPIVTREQLDAAGREVERMRETTAQLRYFDSNKGLLRKKFQTLYNAGPYVSREQFEDVARWEPLLGSMCLTNCVRLGNELLEHRALLKNITRPHPRHEEVLHQYYASFYACAHLYVLSGISPASRELMAKLAPSVEGMTFAWFGVRHGVGYLLYRALWSTGRMGKALLPGQKHRLRGKLTLLGMFDAMLGTAIIGLAHEKLRAEARKALRGPRHVMEDDPRTGPIADLLDAIFDICFDAPEEADRIAVRIGQQMLWPLVPRLPEPSRVERPEDIPAAHARATFVSTTDLMFATADHIEAGFFVLPWLARAEPAELYMPGEIVDLIRRPFSMEAAIDLLDLPRKEDGVRKPRTVERTPGRNDPCPCQSGKKYKRCCGK